MEITLDKLADICSEYDLQFGNWPESKLEGAAVYQFILSALGQAGVAEWAQP